VESLTQADFSAYIKFSENASRLRAKETEEEKN
jgi:hypothetical protein